MEYFKIGDFVRFVDEKREGYITRIIDDSTIGVTDTDGFEIPTAKSNLTFVHGHFSNEESINKLNPKPITSENFIDSGIYLAVTEENKNSVVVHFNLINRSSFQLAFSLSTETDKYRKGEFIGMIQAQGKVQIYTANLGELGQWPDFIFQALLFTVSKQNGKKPLEIKKQFRAKDFGGAKTEIKEINRFGWLIRLDEPEIKIDVQKLKESLFTIKEEKPQVARPNEEVDLHIEKLRDDYQFISEHDILKIQVDFFQKALDAAIVHQMPSIIFIHGVGNGTLRNHIHKTVGKHPNVRTFMDAKKEKFGYGATEVIFLCSLAEPFQL